jgi:hypothetical protein
MIGKHPEVQSQLQNEVDRFYGKTAACKNSNQADNINIKIVQ